MELKEFLDKLIDEEADEMCGKMGAGGPQASELLVKGKKKDQKKVSQDGDNKESSGNVGKKAASTTVKAGTVKANIGGSKTSSYSISRK